MVTVDRRPERARVAQPQIQQRPQRPRLWIFLGSEELLSSFWTNVQIAHVVWEPTNTSRGRKSCDRIKIEAEKPMVKIAVVHGSMSSLLWEVRTPWEEQGGRNTTPCRSFSSVLADALWAGILLRQVALQRVLEIVPWHTGKRLLSMRRNERHLAHAPHTQWKEGWWFLNNF